LPGHPCLLIAWWVERSRLLVVPVEVSTYQGAGRSGAFDVDEELALAYPEDDSFVGFGAGWVELSSDCAADGQQG
jgi:hypothetical protein